MRVHLVLIFSFPFPYHFFLPLLKYWYKGCDSKCLYKQQYLQEVIFIRMLDRYVKTLYKEMKDCGFQVPLDPAELFENATGPVVDWLRACIERGFDVNSANACGRTFFLWFVAKHTMRRDLLFKACEFLCQNGADVNRISPGDGKNALMTVLVGTTSNYNVALIVKTAVMFVHYGTNVNHRDNFGRDVLEYLVFFPAVEKLGSFLPLIKAILENGFDINHAYNVESFLELLYDVVADSIIKPSLVAYDMIELFLENGLDVNSSDGDAQYLLLYLASDLLQRTTTKKKLDLVRLLIRHGIDVEKRDFKGRTALISLCTRAHREIDKEFIELATLLLDSGVDARARTKNGETALDKLIESCEFNRYLKDAVHLLIRRGVGVSKFDLAMPPERHSECYHMVKQAYFDLLNRQEIGGDIPKTIRDEVVGTVHSSIRKNLFDFVLRRQLAGPIPLSVKVPQFFSDSDALRRGQKRKREKKTLTVLRRGYQH